MSTLESTLGPPVPRPSVLQRLSTAWRAAGERRRLRHAELALPLLDAPTLRDLGLARGELLSYWAEADGLVEATRSRVLAHLDSRIGL